MQQSMSDFFCLASYLRANFPIEQYQVRCCLLSALDAWVLPKLISIQLQKKKTWNLSSDFAGYLPLHNWAFYHESCFPFLIWNMKIAWMQMSEIIVCMLALLWKKFRAAAKCTLWCMRKRTAQDLGIKPHFRNVFHLRKSHILKPGGDFHLNIINIWRSWNLKSHRMPKWLRTWGSYKWYPFNGN